MADSTTVQRTGPGFFTLLGLLFIVLKLNPGGNLDTPIKDWSWWLVLLPLYGPLALALALFALGGLVVLFATFFEDLGRKRRQKKIQNMTIEERHAHYSKLREKRRNR